jgi:glucose dehydrogenase
MRISWGLNVILMAGTAAGQQVNAPPAFAAHCAGCHGEYGHGSAKGPGLAVNPRVAVQSAEQLRAFLEQGNPGAGMPSFADLPSADMAAITKYLRRLNRETIVAPEAAGTGRKVRWGEPKEGDWLTYNGSYSGNRYSPLGEITTASVGMMGDARLGTNRGVAILRDKVFFETDNAHLVALDRATGKMVWETAMAPEMTPAGKFHYGGTMAPLIAGDLVIAGVAGADEGIRGFVAAFRPGNGELVWRHWTVPAKGEPGSETWKAGEPLTGGGSTWLTGSYDAETDTRYWATGNPFPDNDDRGRPGDNLYTDCVLALEGRTGKLKWYYQFTPHDLLDRDATEPNVLVDTVYKGRPSKLLLHADRNGMFYVLDRTTGEVLLGKPFLRRDDWASSVGADGKPVVKDPRGCPSDAANWDATAFSPLTHLLLCDCARRVHGRADGISGGDGAAVPAGAGY